MSDINLLTEPEAAELLRCSREKIKRLRLSGQLAYIPGRTVLVRRSDLEAFIESRLVNQTALPPVAQPQKRAENTDAEARAWALQAVLLRRHKA